MREVRRSIRTSYKIPQRTACIMMNPFLVAMDRKRMLD